MVIGHLDITSWVGISLGASHWYCKVIVEENDEDVERVQMTRPLTSKEIAAMNRESQEKYGFSNNRQGDTTEGYWTKEEAVQAGIDYFKSKYNGVLFDGERTSCSAWKKVIVHPPELTALVTEMNKIADMFQGLNGYECEKSKEALVERLDNKWYKKYIKLQELCRTSPRKN